jgi:hypothetical protein
MLSMVHFKSIIESLGAFLRVAGKKCVVKREIRDKFVRMEDPVCWPAPEREARFRKVPGFAYSLPAANPQAIIPGDDHGLPVRSRSAVVIRARREELRNSGAAYQ